MLDEFELIKKYVEQHNSWRARTINLIASENTLSPLARELIVNDWLSRYADFTGRDLDARRYRGAQYINEIEKIVEGLVKRIFHADYVEIRPLSGHLAGVAVLMALCQPGDVVLELDQVSGGHREAMKFNSSPLINLSINYLPFDGEHYNIDVSASIDVIRKTKPKVIILGSSNFLFPHPILELKNAILESNPQGVLVYDASHVLGLLAGGCFQDPLREGADVIFSSTHKTFPGPQGGIILTNRSDLIELISGTTYPGLVTNHHPFRMPSLGIALIDMEIYGSRYANQICANSQALGQALVAEGIPCINFNGSYSKSHTILTRVSQFGTGQDLASQLENVDIICTATRLPEQQGGEGLRLGVQELTYHGCIEFDMKQVAQIIADIILKRRIQSEILMDVHSFTEKLGPVIYTRG